MTYAQMQLPPFTELRRIIQLAGAECGATVSNRRSKILAQAMINRSEGVDASPLSYADPVGETVVRVVTAQLAAASGRWAA